MSANTVETVRTVNALRDVVRAWRRAGETIGLVPTMGALHDGHLGLVRAAQARCDRVIVTLFVNPKQFDRPEELSVYPRGEAEDTAKLAPLGVDLLFAPGVDVMYPANFATTVSVVGVSEGLCGGDRPGHFDGVATVVTKLFLQSLPDAAFFGEKDFQQLQVIRRFATDLEIPVEVVGVETVRAPSGLALSSRNAYLNAEQWEIAPALYRSLIETAKRIVAGENVSSALSEGVRRVIGAGFDSVDYFEFRDVATLKPTAALETPSRLLAAAWLGPARLIDNVAVVPLDLKGCL
jgi:pantoate--beta-alanine ligase